VSTDVVLADQHIRHAQKHLMWASEALREGNLLFAMQNLKDARSDVWYARKHTKREIMGGGPAGGMIR
jgi:hypothetical protein